MTSLPIFCTSTTLATTRFCKLFACCVCSKILGIGCAEQSWEKGKENMSGDWSRLSTAKAKMQATIAGIHAAENNEEDCDKKVRTGAVWDDDDFKTLCLDAHCLPLKLPQMMRSNEEPPASLEPGLMNGKKSTPNLMMNLYWNRAF